jgi:hypothetical protein
MSSSKGHLTLGKKLVKGNQSVRKNSGCIFGYHNKGDFVGSLSRQWSRNAGNMKPLFVGFSRDIVLLDCVRWRCLFSNLLLLLELTEIRGAAVGEIVSYPSSTLSFVFSVMITAIDLY